MAPSTLATLPYELVVQILGHLDSPPYFDEPRLRDNPLAILPQPKPLSVDELSFVRAKHILPPQPITCSTNLKNASLVCHLWRRTLLPLLFKHVVWSFDRFERPRVPDAVTAAESEIPFLRFLISQKLTRHAESVTIIVRHPLNLFGRETLAWGLSPLLPGVTDDSEGDVDDDDTREGKFRDEDEDEDVVLTCNNNWFWHALFQHLDPIRITLIAYPAVLAALLSRIVDLGSAWGFGTPYHILSLSQSPSRSARSAGSSLFAKIPIPTDVPSRTANPEPIDIVIPCDLFAIRKWDSLLLNEGSFIEFYEVSLRDYNYFPPSILPLLLNDNDASFLPLQQTVTSLAYIAIFPNASHISSTLIPSLPRNLRHMYVQIVPREFESFVAPHLELELTAPHLELYVADMWSERDDCYGAIVSAMSSPSTWNVSWNNLQVFETGDTADKEAWGLAVDYFTSNESGWKVEREGVFVRE